jgi:hypothetical protein
MKFIIEIAGKLHERFIDSIKMPLTRYGFKCLFFGVCFLFLGSFVTHPYYVTVTELEYRPAQKELQIACKIFTDDLEDALKAETKKLVRFADEAQSKNLQELIQKYLQQHLKMEIDGKPVTCEMIGYEKEQEAIWSYLTVKNVNVFKSATVYNDMLYRLRDGQINIIHFKVNGITQSYRLNAPVTKHLFNW